MLSAAERCRAYRRRILEVSQQVTALHIAPAFSCLEIVDALYNEIMTRDDVFIMSKGHGVMAQYVVLESRGQLSPGELDNYCKPGGRLGAHPDYGVPGIAASTGSLGHGLAIALGQAYALRTENPDSRVFCLLSDGECQEGSTWEAVMMAANLHMSNLVVLVDHNNWGGLDRISTKFPAFPHLTDKFRAFGWNAEPLVGHNTEEIVWAAKRAPSWAISNRPSAMVCMTTKGKGVSFMEDVPIWHYRSPNPEEYRLAMEELS